MATPGGKRQSKGQLDGVSLAVAAVTLVAFLALLWASFAANDRMAANQGPSRMGVASDGSVWVNSHARLLHIARDGALLQSVALADLGLANPLSHVRVLADGRLIVGQAAPSGLFLCDVGAMRCERLIPAGETAHALMLAVDQSAGRVAVSDNAGHRLLLIDLASRRIIDATEPRRVLHPNGIAFLSDGTLLVSDTDRRTLARFEVGPDGFGKALAEYRVNQGPLRPGRHYPMEFAGTANGKWWVLVAEEGMRNADLMIHQPLGVPQDRVDLGPRSDPTDVVAFGGGVLVAEPLRFRVLAVDGYGTDVRPFGSPELLAELDAARRQHAIWRFVRNYSPIGMAIVPLLAAVFLRVRARRKAD